MRTFGPSVCSVSSDVAREESPDSPGRFNGGRADEAEGVSAYRPGTRRGARPGRSYTVETGGVLSRAREIQTVIRTARLAARATRISMLLCLSRVRVAFACPFFGILEWLGLRARQGRAARMRASSYEVTPSQVTWKARGRPANR
jgi:hypothetical protein